ncbi:hypothetical protein C4B63_4g82 [Trypanosoma cruzi]|uniref:Leucine-rich repeat protein (LRRP) n=1 Tax=Trypanosoma cruzi TaxID=5693 RepID=A0A2V2VYI6_TRYCR|nr:hypothetical protein C4B63_4g82 [Trypanosoma cruzi]
MDEDGEDSRKTAMVRSTTDVGFVDDVEEFVEEEEVTELEEARGNWETPFPRTKRGLQSLRLLDLCSCQIGSAGLKRIGDALRENESLEVLLLRHNHFARKRVALLATEEDADEEAGSTTRVDVPHYVSPGCLSLFGTLTTNSTLKTLDLAYNNMYPESIRALARALSSNTNSVPCHWREIVWASMNPRIKWTPL